MPIKLQTKIASKRLTSIRVNGNSYNVDSDCCIVVDSDADAKKLLSLGDEWSDQVSAIMRGPPSRQPAPGMPMRNAADFVELASQDREVGDKVNSLRSFAALSSFASGLGFKFTEAEFRSAGEAYVASQAQAVKVEEEHKAQMVEVPLDSMEEPEAPKKAKLKK